MTQSPSSKPSTSVYEQATIAVERIAGLINARINSSEPEVFLAGVTELLAMYPRPIIEKSMSAVNGLPAKFKFWPSIAEIKDTLDGWQAEEHRSADLLRRYGEPLPPNAGLLGQERPKHKPYNLLVLREHDGHDAMVKRAEEEPADQWRADPRGIWVPLNWWQERKTARPQKGVKTAAEAARPLVVSPALLKALGEQRFGGVTRGPDSKHVEAAE